MPKTTRKPRKRRSPKKKEVPEEPPSEDEENDLVDSEGDFSGESAEDHGDVSEASEGEASEEEPPKSLPKKTPKKKPAPKKKPEPQEPGRRYFKILIDSIRPEKSPKVESESLSRGGGRYTGNNPMQAAKKAFTRIARASCKGGACTYVFSMQETTQGSAKKVFQYRGVREELKEPQMIKKGDTEYSIKFTSSVRSYKEGAPARKTTSKKKTTRRKT